MRRRLAVLIAALGMSCASLAAAQQNPVVVELYTSQGCSSCPPADAMMHDLATRDDVIALALHVDYWDYIGWTDEFADPAHGARQKNYASVAGDRMVYTPQMVIGGRDHVVGNKPMTVADTIREHLDARSGVRVDLRRSGGRLIIAASAEDAVAGPFVIQLVRFDPERTVSISRGENAGRTLSYANVVTEWRVIANWPGEDDWRAQVPLSGGDEAAVIVQRPGPGEIVAAAKLR